MKVFITGGAGFFGLHLVSYLNKKEWRITAVDIAKFPKDEYPKNVDLHTADVRDGRKMRKLMEGADCVVHAAAALPLWKPEDIHDINVEGTRKLLETARQMHVKQFIYISSTAVYGVPEKHPIVEDDPMIGVGSYGQSKIDAERLCQNARNYGMVVTIIRPKTFVGTHRLGVFEILFDWIRSGKRIPVIGSGDNRYQLLDVDDLVEAVYRFMMIPDKKKADTVFNIGAAHFKTVKRDLGEVFRFAGSGSRILPTPAPIIKFFLRIFEKLKLSPLYQWVYDTADRDSFVSIDRLVNTLNWSPRYSNAQALMKAYRWYLKNYKTIKSGPSGVTHTVGWKQGILGVFKRFL